MSLKARVLSGLLWTSSSVVLRSLFQLVISSLLARILNPSDYGLMAMVTSVHNLLMPFVAVELGAALIRETELTKERLSTAFWLGLGLGAGAAGLLAALAPLVAMFYARPELRLMGQVTAIGYTFASCALVPLALLRRELRFRAIAQVQLSALFVSSLVTLGLAKAGLGVWALVLQGVINASTAALGAWLASGFVPTLQFDRGFARWIFKFSFFSSAGDFAIMSCASLGYAIVARLLGAAPFGLYMRAIGLAQLAVSFVQGISEPVVLPMLAQLRLEPARLRSVCLRAISVSALVLAPLLAAFLTVPEVLIEVLYGPKWVQAAGPLRLLALPILLYGIPNPAWSIFPVFGRNDLHMRWLLSIGVVLLVGSSLGALAGSPTTAALGPVATLLLLLPRFASAGSFVDMSVGDFLRAIRAPVLAALATGLVVLCLRNAVPMLRVQLLALLLAGTGGATYAALTIGLRIEAFSHLRALLKR